MIKSLLSTLLLGLALSAQGQTDGPHWNTPGAGNPFIPGYFADPTIRKFGDTYYLYATTDGNGNGYGPAQVWVSKDFRNWKNVMMSWPDTEVVWAPDVMKANDGRYHYFYCEPCVLHEGVGESPVGPWRNILGKSDAVLVPDRFVHNAITLDGQTFVDDDGAVYLYFGTWGIYEGFGCGVAKMGSDMKSFTQKKLIPNTEIKDFFEAPFVLKKNGVYYFMYSSGSCHDHTYRVQYATSTIGPMGPYVYQGCILETTADETVHGPGHHSVLQDGDDYYIVYHRHNLPRSTHGFHRQVCIDRLVFTPDGLIQKVTPTHQGVVPRSVQRVPQPRNLAFGAKVTASSSYSEWFRPAYAVDDNNATLWKPATCTDEEWLLIDLGEPTTFREVWTQFEYSTYYYQYKLETSVDGSQWSLYADQRANTRPASPCIDKGDATARYLRLTVTGRQKNGHFGGVWNVKVFDKAPVLPDMTETVQPSTLPQAWSKPDVTPEERETRRAKGNRVVDICADDYPLGSSLTTINNRVGGTFRGEQSVKVALQQGRQAFRFTGSQLFRGDFPLPATLRYSAPYTISAWVLNPEVAKNECVVLLMPERHDLSTVELCNGSDAQNGLVMHNGTFENSGSPLITRQQGKWQHWVITYDGYMERHYLNGRQVSEKNMMLLLRPRNDMHLGASFDGKNPFDGYLHALQVYDRMLTASEVAALSQQPSESPVLLQLMAAECDSTWQNQGRWGGVALQPSSLSLHPSSFSPQPSSLSPHPSALSPQPSSLSPQPSALSPQPSALSPQPKLVLTTPVTIKNLSSQLPAKSVSVSFALQKGTKKGTLLTMSGLQLSVSRKGIICNGQLTKAPLKQDVWNLLVLNHDGTCWLNGEKLQLPFREFPRGPKTLTVGGQGIALVGLQIEDRTIDEAQHKEAYLRLTNVPEHLSATLQVVPLSPQLLRLSLSAPSPLSWRIDEHHPWTTEPSLLVSVPTVAGESASQTHRVFQATIRDEQGNIAQTNRVELSLDQRSFISFTDDFSQSGLNPSWKILRGKQAQHTEATVSDGQLVLQSAGGNFNAHADENAILVYQEVTGDFLMQGRLTHLMGEEHHRTPAYNEGGLMVLDDSDPDNQLIVQAGIFPNYNCGNMLTTVSHHGMRPQFPVGNGWQFEPYLQIERQGNTFFVRTSKDGCQWTDAQGSPVVLPVKDAHTPTEVRSLKVGFFQVTYTDKLGSASFDDFQLWEQKKL